ncbi:mast/stem cell growth factor receptor kita isoform X1, partial [Tachysurus ichikawai]
MFDLFDQFIGSTKPVITPDGSQLAVQLYGQFVLRCHGEAPVRWLREDRPTRIIKEEKRDHHLSTINVTKVTSLYRGNYICLEESTGQSNSIYVYVT